jgi:hypothetical protein
MLFPSKRGHATREHDIVLAILFPNKRGHATREHVLAILFPSKRGHATREHVLAILFPSKRGSSLGNRIAKTMYSKTTKCLNRSETLRLYSFRCFTL